MKRPGTWMRPESPQQRLMDRITHPRYEDRIVIDSRALNEAAEVYIDATGDVDDLALGAAILAYLEAL